MKKFVRNCQVHQNHREFAVRLYQQRLSSRSELYAYDVLSMKALIVHVRTLRKVDDFLYEVGNNFNEDKMKVGSERYKYRKV